MGLGWNGNRGRCSYSPVQLSDWLSVGSFGVSVVSAGFAIYATVRGWKEKQRGDMLAAAFKTLDDQVAREHQVLLLRLGEDSTRAVELFKRRLDLVGPLWRAIVSLRGIAAQAPSDIRLSRVLQSKAGEAEAVSNLARAIKDLVDTWTPVSPIMKDARKDVDQLIHDARVAVGHWGESARRLRGPSDDTNTRLDDMPDAKEEVARRIAYEAIPSRCDEVLRILTQFVDDRVAEVEASALTSGSPAHELQKSKTDDIQK